MAFPNEFESLWRDATGKTGTFSCWITDTVVDPADALITALLNATKAISDAALNEHEILPIDGTIYGTATPGPYDDAIDKLVMLFQDEVGARHHVKIPAPDEAVFTSDKETPDETNTQYINLKSAIETYGRSSNDLDLFYIRGWRSRSRRIKRY